MHAPDGNINFYCMEGGYPDHKVSGERDRHGFLLERLQGLRRVLAGLGSDIDRERKQLYMELELHRELGLAGYRSNVIISLRFN